ncbi:hypothetical protein B0H14DRAFT_2418654 [Mycena olivaceomarginata]|nr:hypothetical protein B0H14DRAFT_2418654 [Mycena olivaceomarginata]
MLQSRSPLPSNEDNLWCALQEWMRMDENYIAKLYKSMPRRMRALHEVKGGSTC